MWGWSGWVMYLTQGIFEARQHKPRRTEAINISLSIFFNVCSFSVLDHWGQINANQEGWTRGINSCVWNCVVAFCIWFNNVTFTWLLTSEDFSLEYIVYCPAQLSLSPLIQTKTRIDRWHKTCVWTCCICCSNNSNNLFGPSGDLLDIFHTNQEEWTISPLSQLSFANLIFTRKSKCNGVFKNYFLISFEIQDFSKTTIDLLSFVDRFFISKIKRSCVLMSSCMWRCVCVCVLFIPRLTNTFRFRCARHRS